jgi:hypothetical protein
MGKDLLTKVAKGVAFGDVSNQAVRNILTELSKTIYGGITEQEMEDTMAFFDWKCPYTGRPLRISIDKSDGSYATDHIYPQNKDWCGLNVKGNLIIVDKEANKAKGRLDIDTFMKTDSDFWSSRGIDLPTRLKRLKKIKDFQEECKYDPDRVRIAINRLLNEHYVYIRNEQEKFIKELLSVLGDVGIKEPEKEYLIAPTEIKFEDSKDEEVKSASCNLVFHPMDERAFKEALLKSRKAHFVLTYDSGAIKETSWDARSFEETSNLRRNIESKTFWRKRKSEGLIKVDVFVD